MTLATTQDVVAALGRALAGAESGRVASLLDEASDLVVGYLYPCEIADPVPGAISRVVATMVAAVFSRPGAMPADTQTSTMGPFGITFAQGSTSTGPYLSTALKSRLAPFRCGNGMTSVQLGSERS